MRQLRARSGTWLVVAMFGFGLALATGLYVYLTLHTAPFRSLTAALDDRYPDSAPRVDGGKRRLDRPGERVLRIILKAPFDPEEDESRAESFGRGVAAFAAERRPEMAFDLIEVHLYFERPEQKLSQRTVRVRVEELAPSLKNGAER